MSKASISIYLIQVIRGTIGKRGSRLYSLAGGCALATCVSCAGFMRRARISNMIPTAMNAMLEKNARARTTLYHRNTPEPQSLGRQRLWSIGENADYEQDYTDGDESESQSLKGVLVKSLQQRSPRRNLHRGFKKG
jgi:hypothetical protein